MRRVLSRVDGVSLYLLDATTARAIGLSRGWRDCEFIERIEQAFVCRPSSLRRGFLAPAAADVAPTPMGSANEPVC